MILSFANAQAKAIFVGRSPGKGFPPELVRPALRKLAMLDAAATGLKL
jgi:toxin HigB-1